MTSIMSLIIFSGIEEINVNLQKKNHSISKYLFFSEFLKIRMLYFLKADTDFIFSH